MRDHGLGARVGIGTDITSFLVAPPSPYADIYYDKKEVPKTPARQIPHGGAVFAEARTFYQAGTFRILARIWGSGGKVFLRPPMIGYAQIRIVK